MNSSQSTKSWSEVLDEIYQKTVLPEGSQRVNEGTNGLINLLCIDGLIHIPLGVIKTGILSTCKDKDTVYVCTTTETALEVLTPFITNKPFSISSENVFDVNKVIFAAMSLKVEPKGIVEQVGKWLLRHQNERLDGVAETWTIDNLLITNKPLAFSLHDFLSVPQNTQNVYSCMILDNDTINIECSPENMGVLAGFCGEKIMKEGGEWYKQLHKLLVVGRKNKDYVQPLFVVSWRICSEERCQLPFVQNECFKEVVTLMKMAQQEDLELTYIEILVLLLENEEAIKTIEENGGIDLLIELMKKNISMKLIEQTGLRALSLYCGTEENNRKVIQNKWIYIVRDILQTYSTDETIQNIGLNVIIKIGVSKESNDTFIEMGLLDQMIETVKKNENNFIITSTCFQIIGGLVKDTQYPSLLNSFDLILQTSHRFENEIIVITGCLYALQSIFLMEGTSDKKTNETIKWIMELCLKFIDNDEIVVISETVIMTLLREGRTEEIKNCGCLIIMSSILTKVYSFQEKKNAVILLNEILKQKVEIDEISVDIIMQFFNNVIEIDDETISVKCVECICNYYNYLCNKNIDFEYSMEHLVDYSIKISKKYPNELCATKTVELIFIYMAKTQNIEKFQNDKWDDCIIELIIAYPKNEELIKNGLKIRQTLYEIPNIFSCKQITLILQILKYHFENTIESEMISLLLFNSILFICPYNEGVKQLVKSMIEEEYYYSLTSKQQKNQSVANMFFTNIFSSLIISIQLSNTHSSYELFTSNIWDVFTTIINDSAIMMNLSTLPIQSFLLSLTNNSNNNMALNLQVLSIFCMTTSNDTLHSNFQFIYDTLTKSNEIIEQRNCLIAFAIASHDVIRKEETIFKNTVTYILNLLSDDNCPSDYVLNGLCVLHNICGLSAFRKKLSEPKNYEIINKLSTKYTDCSGLINQILKRAKEGYNKNGFNVQN